MTKRSSRARKPVDEPGSSSAPPPVVEKKKPVKRPVVETISFPVSEKDEEIVECSICNAKSTFREFRIHNITAHYNIASTVGDPVERNYKFFVRQLQDMAKLMKISVFKCPLNNCESKYKSALGLAYHLENCGKTEAEKLAAYVKCEFCGKSYPKTGIAGHKQTHKRAEEDKTADENDPDITEVSEPRRRSAVKAQQKIKKISVQTDHVKHSAHDSDEDFVIKEEFEDDDDDEREKSSKKLQKRAVTLENDEVQMRDIGDEEQNVWDKPERVVVNFFPLTNFPVNPLQSFDNEDEARTYLPSVLNSIEFKVKTNEKSTDFHRLSMFESELVDGESGNNVINVGGPVSSMSWHPSGKYLALSTLKDIKIKPNVLENEENRTCIQLYKNVYYKPINDDDDEEDTEPFTGLDLQLVLGVDNGFIHHLQWSSFWPNESEDFIGHLAYSCGDSNVAISFIRKSFLDKECNVSMDSSVNISSDLPRMIRLYKKVPEILLRLNDPYIENSGQCVTFDWHESSEYLVAGYGKGLVAVYSLQNTSKFLRKVQSNNQNNTTTTELQPIWYIRAHTDVISSIQFNPANPRYFVTCSYDYYVKTWDLKLRQEMESKKVGMVLAAGWIRGWVHLVISSEILNANFQSSTSNVVRFFQVGSAKNYISCAEQFNVTAVSFFEGMTALGSEVGRVNIVYFDQYLRECDYDRNRKKKNTVNFSKIIVEKNEDLEEDVETGEMGRHRLVFSVDKKRRESHQDAPEPTLKDMENYINSYYLIRINKVSWSPNGQQLVTGYHNGLLLVTPTSFKDLYGVYVTRRR